MPSMAAVAMPSTAVIFATLLTLSVANAQTVIHSCSHREGVQPDPYINVTRARLETGANGTVAIAIDVVNCTYAAFTVFSGELPCSGGNITNLGITFVNATVQGAFQVTGALPNTPYDDECRSFVTHSTVNITGRTRVLGGVVLGSLFVIVPLWLQFGPFFSVYVTQGSYISNGFGLSATLTRLGVFRVTDSVIESVNVSYATANPCALGFNGPLLDTNIRVLRSNLTAVSDSVSVTVLGSVAGAPSDLYIDVTDSNLRAAATGGGGYNANILTFPTAINSSSITVTSSDLSVLSTSNGGNILYVGAGQVLSAPVVNLQIAVWTSTMSAKCTNGVCGILAFVAPLTSSSGVNVILSQAEVVSSFGTQFLWFLQAVNGSGVAVSGLNLTMRNGGNGNAGFLYFMDAWGMVLTVNTANVTYTSTATTTLHCITFNGNNFLVQNTIYVTYATIRCMALQSNANNALVSLLSINSSPTYFGTNYVQTNNSALAAVGNSQVSLLAVRVMYQVYSLTYHVERTNISVTTDAATFGTVTTGVGSVNVDVMTAFSLTMGQMGLRYSNVLVDLTGPASQVQSTVSVFTAKSISAAGLMQSWFTIAESAITVLQPSSVGGTSAWVASSQTATSNSTTVMVQRNTRIIVVSPLATVLSFGAMATGSNYVTIDRVFVNQTSPTAAPSGTVVVFGTLSSAQIFVTNSAFYSNYASVYFLGGIAASTVQITVANNTVSGGTFGVAFGGTTAFMSSSVTVSNNVIAAPTTGTFANSNNCGVGTQWTVTNNTQQTAPGGAYVPQAQWQSTAYQCVTFPDQHPSAPISIGLIAGAAAGAAVVVALIIGIIYCVACRGGRIRGSGDAENGSYTALPTKENTYNNRV